LDKADNINLLKHNAPKGIVNPQAAPAAALAPFVDYYWIVEWACRRNG